MVRSKNFYLYIVDSIQKDGKLPRLGISRQQLNYYVRRLKVYGVIYKKGYATWGLNIDNLKYIPQLKQVKHHHMVTQDSLNSGDIRTHAVILVIKLPKINKWDIRTEYFDSIGLNYKEVRPGWQKIVYMGHRIWMTDTKLTIYQPKTKSYYSSTADDGLRNATYRLLGIITRLQKRLKTDFTHKGRYKWRIGRQHFAKIRNELAAQYRKEGRRLKVESEDGVWLITDQSFTDELETIHKATAGSDMDNAISPFFNDLRDYYKETGEYIRMSDVIKVQVMFAENIKTHIEAIQTLSKSVKELTDQVKKIRG